MGSFLKCLMIKDFKDYTFTNLCQSRLVNFMVCMINMLIFICYYYCFFFLIFFAPLLLGISTCYSTREPFYLSGITC